MIRYSPLNSAFGASTRNVTPFLSSRISLRAPVVLFAEARREPPLPACAGQSRRVHSLSPFTNSFPSAGSNSASQPSSCATPARSPKNSRCSRPMFVMHAELRLDHLHQRREFARMIRAGFQHGGLVRFFQPQQRQRHADVVVETGLAPQRRPVSAAAPTRSIPSSSSCRSSRPRRSSAASKSLPIRRRQPAQRRARIVHGDHRAVRQTAREFSCSTTTAATPLAATSFRKSWPSNRSPGMAKNKSPACACRESVQTRRTAFHRSRAPVSAAQASATNFKERVSTANAPDAVTEFRASGDFEARPAAHERLAAKRDSAHLHPAGCSNSSPVRRFP